MTDFDHLNHVLNAFKLDPLQIGEILNGVRIRETLADLAAQESQLRTELHERVTSLKQQREALQASCEHVWRDEGRPTAESSRCVVCAICGKER